MKFDRITCESASSPCTRIHYMAEVLDSKRSNHVIKIDQTEQTSRVINTYIMSIQLKLISLGKKRNIISKQKLISNDYCTNPSPL